MLCYLCGIFRFVFCLIVLFVKIALYLCIVMEILMAILLILLMQYSDLIYSGTGNIAVWGKREVVELEQEIKLQNWTCGRLIAMAVWNVLCSADYN